MSKLERWLTLVANLSVVAGIVFLAVEMHQNTEMMRAQIRDSITEKQMEYISWRATSPELSAIIMKAQGGAEALEDSERSQFLGWVGGQFREWENSHYQYEQGLFDDGEYASRRSRWESQLSEFGDSEIYRSFWADIRNEFSPSFRAEIDRIVAEGGQAQ